MADVFISYKREDRRWADLLDARLRAAGFTTWWDTSLAAGDAFTEVIQRELAAAQAVVVIWSEAARTSRWVQAEATDAYGREILVCARADDVVVGVPFNIIEMADLRAASGLESILRGVEAKVSRQKHSPPPAAASVLAPARRYGRITGAHRLFTGTGALLPYCSPFSRDGSQFAICNPGQQTAEIRDVATGDVRGQIRGHGRLMGVPRLLSHLAFSAHGDYLASTASGASGGTESRVLIWESATGALATEIIVTQRTFEPSLARPRFSPSAPLLLVGACDTARVVAIPSGQTTVDLEYPVYTNTYGNGDDWTPGGESVLTVSESIRVFDARTGRMRCELRLPLLSAVFMVRISPDGRRLAGFVDGKTLRVWNLDRGVLEHEIIVHRASIQSIAFSADGLQIYAGSRDGDVKVLDATNGRTLTTFSIPKNCFFEIDDARGRLLVSGAKGFAAILDAKTGEMLFSCHTPNTRLAPLWSPDGLAYCVQMGGGAYEVHRIEENKVRD